MSEKNSPPPYTEKEGWSHLGENGVDNKAFDSNGDVEIEMAKTKKEDPEEVDPWEMPELQDTDTPWKELSTVGKVWRITWSLIRLVLLIGLLYLFFCSLDLRSSAFRLLAGKTAGHVFRDNALLSNPVCGVMIGVLATVLVQSSSTTTSIVVSMVAADGLLDVKSAIPIVMGANIGTSVTNTIVSLGQITNKGDFRRAFAGATVHDMFNWLTVILFLPIEAATGYLYYLSGVVVESISLSKYENADTKLLKAATEPFTKLIVEVDSKAIEHIAQGQNRDSLLKRCCRFKKIEMYNETSGLNYTVSECQKKCHHLFMKTDLKDNIIGVIMLISALLMLCLCLLLIVKILNSLLKGNIQKAIKKFVNYEFPGKCAYFTGYVALIFGTGFTILVQSSSIFTSTLTPFVGVGVVSLDRMYPLTLGANIGTTTTGLLAALATDTENGVQNLRNALRIALCHLFFNISGIIVWYPIPFMRFPIPLSKFLGNETAKYRWFSIFYLIMMFFLCPLLVFGLSVAGIEALLGVGIPIVVLVFTVGIIKLIQNKRPKWLPHKLRNWKFLPLCCRSLQPLDNAISKICVCCKMCRKEEEESDVESKIPENNNIKNDQTRL